MQFVIALAPAAEVLLEGHWYLSPALHHDPVSHSVHGPPWVPYQPDLHVHALEELLPVCDRVFRGQLTCELPPVQ